MNVIRFWLLAALLGLAGCGTFPASPQADRLPFRQLSQLEQLLPADAILLGEKHDAPDHQRIHRLVVDALVARQVLAALVLEMSPQGQSTDLLTPPATEAQVQIALQWDDEAWPWAAYGPAVMAAVRAGVPVLGGNLPKAQMREAMADKRLDGLLSGPALKAQQQNIRLGHCELLPESQISPMTRIQIARDVAMAHTLTQAAVPGKTVLLLAGNGHVDRTLGVVQHLPPQFMAKTVFLGVERAQAAIKNIASFDQAWPAQPAPDVDYCAHFAARQPAQP